MVKVIKIRSYNVGISIRTGDTLRRLGKVFYVKSTNKYWNWYHRKASLGDFKIDKEFEEL